MSIDIPPIAINNIWRRTGRRRVEYSFARSGPELGRLTAGRGGGPLGLFLAWRSADFDFLDVEARGLAPDGGKDETFQAGWPAVLQLFQKMRLTAIDCAPDFPTKNRFRAGILPASGVLSLRFALNTDAESFRKLDRARGDRADTEPVLAEILLAAFDAAGVFDQGKLQLQIRPARLPAEYTGHAALDVGNASTALAFLPAGFLDLGRMHSVPADDPAEAPVRGPIASIESIVRIDEFRPATAEDPNREAPEAYDWKVGEVALDTKGGDGVIFGAKRLLAGPDANEGMPLHVYLTDKERDPQRVRQPARIPKRLPGDLLVCRLLQRFRQVTVAQPPPLAMTFPTTYSREEIGRLQNAVCRAWCRQAAYKQTDERLEEVRRKQTVLLLDEASAAAFGSLFPTVVGQPGGLTRFAYLFPQGCNLLLYDMGAGTIDLALVKARALPEGKPTRLEVEVAGRTGLRDFGGDEITVAAFRLLKALVAQNVAEVLGQDLPRLPEKEPDKLARHLQDHDGAINRLVPTQFDRERMNAEDRTRRASTKALWLLAQGFKHRLEDKKAQDKVAPFPSIEERNDFWAELKSRLKAAGWSQLQTALTEARLARGLLDALVRGPIEESIARCNWLIANKLLRGSDVAEDVHRVEIVGNGARYPLVGELLRDGLNVAFYGERHNCDKANLKGAVARGALLWLAVREGAFGIRMKFDDKLAERLPFDVAYSHLKVGGERPLFREHQLYEELQPQTIQLPPDDGQPARALYLHRRWPGEKKYHPYLLFPFPKGIRGPITVSFERASGFVAEVDGARMRTPQLLTDTELYLAPPERGTL
jgi:hypothetical protein